jgi:hypothetical protein
VVEALVLPRLLPAFLDALRLVERLQFHQAPILATLKRMRSRSDYWQRMPQTTIDAA